MKLATFSARIGACGQIRFIELASHERCGNLFGVYAGNTCPEARQDHLARNEPVEVTLLPEAQNGCPVLRYVVPLNDTGTKLADFFTSRC